MWMLLGVLVVLAGAPARPECAVTDAVRAEALTLNWQDFDQKPDSPAGMRRLAMAGCFREAAELQEYYIANRKGLTAGEIVNSKFHIGQNYANAGMPDRALTYFKQSINPNQPKDSKFDWNAYVQGVIAFFERDRAALQRALSALRASPEPGNQMNGRALARMNKCFDHSYSELWKDPACEAP